MVSEVILDYIPTAEQSLSILLFNTVASNNAFVDKCCTSFMTPVLRLDLSRGKRDDPKQAADDVLPNYELLTNQTKQSLLCASTWACYDQNLLQIWPACVNGSTIIVTVAYRASKDL